MKSEIMDNLSSRYDFIYFIRNKKKFFIFLFFIYSVFVIGIILLIYFRKGFWGVFDEISSIFVDSAIFFIFAILGLLFKHFFDDEKIRIKETKEYSEIYEIAILCVDTNYAKVILDKEKTYKTPPILENLLKWVNFNKDSFFKNNFGSIDISKICLEKIIFTNKNIKFFCKQASFYDIVYTHYFPDYELYNKNGANITLRNMLESTLLNFYKNNTHSNKNSEIECFNLLPNPIGITGIVNLSFDNKCYYLLQLRDFNSAAARKRLQWSFAGIIDVLPSFYKESFEFTDMVYSEFKEEILDNFDILRRNIETKDIKSKILGIVLNKLYLYQPEIFVKIDININNEEKFGDIGIFLKNNVSTLNKIKKIENFIIVQESSLRNIEYLIKNNNLKLGSCLSLI